MVAITGRSSSGVPNVSRSPCTISTGTRIDGRCSVRGLSGSSGRVKRVSERDDPPQAVESLRAQVRRHAAAHRFPADEHPLLATPLARGVDHLSKRRSRARAPCPGRDAAARMYGKSKVTTEMRRAARPFAVATMNGCF